MASSTTCLTENGAAAHNLNDTPLLKAFASIVRDTSQTRTSELIMEAWNCNPKRTVQLILHLRDPRGGKGEKTAGLAARAVLSKVPETFKLTLKNFVDNGCFLDLVKLAPTHSYALDLLGQTLHDDWVNFTSGDKTNISLAAKWAPTEKHKYDTNNIILKLDKAMFPGKKSKQPHKRYRQAISALRDHLCVVERKMSANRWADIDYTKVPAKASLKYTKAFGTHDLKRYTNYIHDLVNGNTTVKIAGLAPHEIARKAALKPDSILYKEMWNQLVYTHRGFANDAVCVVDVSGSMKGVPMDVAVALGLLISELTNPPFKDTMITFHSTPELVLISGDSIGAKLNMMKNAEWGGSTNIYAVFELILETAISFNIPANKMVKTLYIFTDMQFDEAVEGSSLTVYDQVKQLYANAGYEVPMIVFWNLRAVEAFPIAGDTPNTVLLSGFSANLLRDVFSGSPVNINSTAPSSIKQPFSIEINPLSVMENVLDKYPGCVAECDLNFRFDTTYN